MFEDRRRLFVDLLRWDVPVVEDRFEADAFDDEEAVYIVAEIDGGHAGSLRLLRTDRPHLLDTLFTHLCPFGVPTGDDTREITRLCLPQRLGAARRLAVRNALIAAMVDHAVGSGIRRLTGVVTASFRREILTMGWLAEPLGPATLHESQNLGAFALHVDARTLMRLTWTGVGGDDRSSALQAAA